MPRQNQTQVRALELLQDGERRAVEICESLQVSAGKLSLAMRVPVRDGTVMMRREGHAVFYSLPQAPEPVVFRAARWADGDVDLYGIIELDDGGFRLTPDMLKQVLALVGPVTP